MRRRALWSVLALCLVAGACAVWYFGLSPPRDSPVKQVVQKSPNRTEFRLGEDKSENARVYTFVEDKVRKVEVRFADGTLGYRHLDGTDAKGEPVLTKLEEYTKEAALVFEMTPPDELGNIKVKTLEVFRREDGKTGTRARRFADGVLTMYAENGQAVAATLQLNDSGYTFVPYAGKEPGRETKLFEEVYSESWGGGGPYGGGGMSQTTKFSVFEGTTRKYVQTWRPQSSYNGYYYGGQGRFQGRVGGPGLMNPYGQSVKPSLTLLEYYYSDADTPERQISRDNYYDGMFGFLTAYQIKYLDREGNTTGFRYLREDLTLQRFEGKNKEGTWETVRYPEGTKMKEELRQADLNHPLTDVVLKLREDALQPTPNHLQRLLVE